MTTFISIMLVLACFIVVAAVLLQPAKSGVTALGGSSNSVFGSTGGTTFLFRLTMWTAALIMAGCLFMSWYKIRTASDSAVLSTTPIMPTAPVDMAPGAAPGAAIPPITEPPATSPAGPTPGAPIAPAAPATN